MGRANIELAKSLIKHIGLVPGTGVVLRPESGGFHVFVKPSVTLAEKPTQWMGHPVSYEVMPRAYPQKRR